MVAWKKTLLDDWISPKTINDSKLAALKAVLGWAADNELLRENPTARVAVKRAKKPAKKPGERMLGFGLPAARNPPHRWQFDQAAASQGQH